SSKLFIVQNLKQIYAFSIDLFFFPDEVYLLANRALWW
ncbi:MAG: hypothetical protein ACI9U0_001618, partial [Flavobacteriales bacterium]